MKNLADQIIKQADLINDLQHIIKLNIDDEATDYGMRVLKILDQLAKRAESVLDKNEINDVKEDVEKIMILIQKTHEKLYVLQQRLVEEKKLV
jgi:hypothetical protein